MYGMDNLAYGESKEGVYERYRYVDMKEILIIGSGGFIGRNLKEYLEKKSDKFHISFPSSKELDCLNEEQVTNYLKNKGIFRKNYAEL